MVTEKTEADVSQRYTKKELVVKEVTAGEILLGNKKEIAIMSELPTWNKWLRKLVKTPSLEVFKPQLDKQP